MLHFMKKMKFVSNVHINVLNVNQKQFAILVPEIENNNQTVTVQLMNMMMEHQNAKNAHVNITHVQVLLNLPFATVTE